MRDPQRNSPRASAAPAVRMLEEADWEWRRRGPTSQAVRAFGVRPDALTRLPGGAGHAWTDGRLVLKPVGFVPEHTWVCEVYAGWADEDVRVPEPVLPGAWTAWDGRLTVGERTCSFRAGTST